MSGIVCVGCRKQKPDGDKAWWWGNFCTQMCAASYGCRIAEVVERRKIVIVTRRDDRRHIIELLPQ